MSTEHELLSAILCHGTCGTIILLILCNKDLPININLRNKVHSSHVFHGFQQVRRSLVYYLVSVMSK